MFHKKYSRYLWFSYSDTFWRNVKVGLSKETRRNVDFFQKATLGLGFGRSSSASLIPPLSLPSEQVLALDV